MQVDVDSFEHRSRKFYFDGFELLFSINYCAALHFTLFFRYVKRIINGFNIL